MIVFDEETYIKKHYIDNKNFTIRNMEELCDVVRYYKEQNKDVLEVSQIVKKMNYSKIISFYINDFEWFMAVYIKATSRPLYKHKTVWVSKYEYDFIRKINDVEKEKIVFAMLVVSKFFNKEVIKLTMREIKKFSLTQREKESLHNSLIELCNDGYISIYENKHYKVNVDSMKVRKSENFISVEDYNHITTPYTKTLKTDEYFFCENCGRKIKYKKNDEKNNKIRKFCSICSKK